VNSDGVPARLELDADVRAAYSADASGLVLVPDAVARPTSADEVAALLTESNATRTAVTAAGAQTSTTAASITDRGVLLSLRAMNRIIALDPVARTVR
jgi:glycolate oxidase